MQMQIEQFDNFFRGYEALSEQERRVAIYDYVEAAVGGENDNFGFAVLLLAAMAEGANFTKLSEFIQLPLAFVTEVADRMTAAGLWLPDGSVDYDFLTAPSGRKRLVAFSISLLVAQGLVVWTGKNRNGRKVYQITEAGRAEYEFHAAGGSSNHELMGGEPD